MSEANTNKGYKSILAKLDKIFNRVDNREGINSWWQPTNCLTEVIDCCLKPVKLYCDE